MAYISRSAAAESPLLGWLPEPPSDFSQRCRSVLDAPGDAGHRLRALATYSLDENQLNRLARVIEKLKLRGDSLAPLIPFRLGILSNSTTDFLVPALVGSAPRHGIALECVMPDYAQFMQEALSPESSLNAGRPEGVLIAVDYRGYPLAVALGNRKAADATVETAFAQLQAIRAGVRANSNAICIVQNLAPPPEALFGSLDRVVPGTALALIDDLNQHIALSIASTSDILFDVAALASAVGLANWHSPAQWNMAKLPFSSSFIPLYAEHLSRTIGALRGKGRRCLVLDLDNTVWGGVIGDDGLEGIQIAQGDASGEAYLSVQRYALALRERGVVLAVSSKNDDEVARLPFRNHPEMLLREDHIAVFQANWNDKATNIKAIAKELALGLESMVFLDDNPVERGLVRELLPEVAVPELPPDPAWYVRTLSEAGYFDSAMYSEEDFKRATFYQDNARRVSLQKQSQDIKAYLESLRMVITFQPFDQTGRARITQLINKSNQFNLTTRRYTEAEVAQAEQDPNCFTLQVRLADTFGDNGMISVIICRNAGEGITHERAWEIDTWLMSCRVLGRRVENIVLAEVLNAARLAGVQKLIGRYIPTARNRLVEEHYQRLGFTEVGRQPDGTTILELDVNTTHVETAPMDIRRFGFDSQAPSPGPPREISRPFRAGPD
jgi:FkbH-like protein